MLGGNKHKSLIRYLSGLHSLLIRLSKKVISGVLRAYSRVASLYRKRAPAFMQTRVFGVSVLAFTMLAIVILGFFTYRQMTYSINKASKKIIASSTVGHNKIKQTKDAFIYEAEDKSSTDGAPTEATIFAPENTKSVLYSATLPKQPKDGIVFGDEKGERTFRMTPLYDISEARYEDGRVVYPAGLNERHIYSFKKNGLKQDILLSKRTRSEVMRFSWKLDIGTDLEARLLPTGSVGIYSADPLLYGSLSIADEKSQKLVDNARKNGEKNHLVYKVPNPYIIDATGAKNFNDVSYTYKDGVLTLEARNLRSKRYPLTIDPTVVITTTSDFQTQTGSKDNIDASTSDQIARGFIDSGATDIWTDNYAGGGDSITTYVGNGTNGTNGVTYVTRIFTDTSRSKMFVAKSDVSIDYIAVAGGGGGGSNRGGGGGAGGMITGSMSLTAGDTIRVTVGAGGTGSHSSASKGSTGDVTIFDTTTVDGGGGGGSHNYPSGDTPSYGASGGSGGGAAMNYFSLAFTAGSGTSGQGNNGGAATATTSYRNTGGGGGKGGAGTAGATTATRPNGGVGQLSYIMGGSGTYYAGGGGGGTASVDFPGAAAGTGGSGGGGNGGGVGAVGSNATANTGGGGGGGADSAWGGDGGSGIVAIRYPVSSSMAFSTARSGHSTVAYNGYIYVIGGCSTSWCTGFQSDVQYAAINSDGTLGAWASTTSFSTGRYNHTSVVNNGYMYVMGGCSAGSCTTLKNDVQYAPINSDGTVGTWNSTTSFTTARHGHTSVVNNGYVYVIGGCTSGACSAYASDVQYAKINTDGTVGSWSTTTSFTTARYMHTSVTYNGYLYVIGGYSGSYSTGVQYARINTDGTVGSWSTTTALSTARSSHTSVVNNGYLYVIGGYNGSSYLSSVQYAVVNADGTIGSWSTTYSIMTARSSHASVAYNGYLYTLGGYANSANTNDIQMTQLGAGMAGDYNLQSTAFTTARGFHSSVAYNGYLYIVGGSNVSQTTLYNDIQYCPLNSDGSVGTCTQQTSAFTTARYYHSSVVYNGYLYIIGGCGSTGTCSSYQNDISRCAINANGSVTTPCTQQTSVFTNARSSHTSVVQNGYLYIIGGWNGTSYYNDIIKCTISATDGSVSGCASSNTFTTGRRGHTSVIYGGYIYIIGGYDGTSYYDDIQRCPIGAAGAVGSCTVQSGMLNNAIRGHTSVAYNGYIYVTGGVNGVTTYATLTECSISSDASIGSCHDQRFAFSGSRYAHSTALSNGYMYMIGGSNIGSVLDDIQYFNVGPPNSRAGTFTVNSNYFSNPRRRSSTLAYNGYLYVVGGEQASSSTSCKNSGTSTMCNDVQYAAVNVDGSIGTFTTNSNYFSIPRASHTSFISNGYLYVVGGVQANSDTNCKNSGTSTYCNDVQYAAINASNGSVGAFTTNTNYFAYPRFGLASAVYKGRVYITGGDKGSSSATCVSSGSDSFCNDVQYATINSDGSLGAFTTNTNYFTTPRAKHSMVVYNGIMYIMAGYSTSSANCKNTGTNNFCNDVQYATINSNGTVGTFTTNGTYVPSPRNEHSSFAYNGYMYVVGGYKYAWDATCRSSGSDYFCQDVQSAPINSDGSLGDFQTNRNFFSYPRYAQGAVVYNGKLYVVGGNEFTSDTNCKNTGTSSLCSDIQYTSLAANQNIARYERTIDTSTSSTGGLQTFTINGTSLCGYTVTYWTASTSGVYGSATTVQNVMPGVAQTVSSGTNKRYMLLSVTMDDSVCGGISTVTDITLQYNNQPDTPTLISPTTSSTGVPLLPELRLATTDAEGDYLQYKIEICSTSNCSSVVQTIDQSSSQTGWQSQSVQSATAYSSSSSVINQHAIYQVQTPLSANTQYWWRGYAIDPAGLNSWSSASAISTFTTVSSPTPSQVNIRGGTTIKGGTSL